MTGGLTPLPALPLSLDVGFDDFLISSSAQPPAGETYVLFGHDGSFPGRVDLLGLDDMHGFTVNGVEGSSLVWLWLRRTRDWVCRDAID